MALPNFLVIGAGRSGTTSLHHYLGRHPDVFMSPRKSPNFFVAEDLQPEWEVGAARVMASYWIRDRREYEALFDGVRTETAIGEASPVYLQSIAAPRRIREICPDARLVAVLRDPVERAWAHFLGRRRDGLESRAEFAQVVAEELARPWPETVAFGSYLGAGRYHHFLSEYYRLFPRDRIRVHLFEQFRAAPAVVLRDLFEFLEVDPELVPKRLERLNATGNISNPILRHFWTTSVDLRTSMRPWLPDAVRNVFGRLFLHRLDRPVLDPDLRAELVARFRPEIERLQALVERDLSDWLRHDVDAATRSSAPGGAPA